MLASVYKILPSRDMKEFVANIFHSRSAIVRNEMHPVDLRRRQCGGGLLTTKHIDSRVNVSRRSERAAHLSGPPALFSPRKDFRKQNLRSLNPAVQRGVLPPIGRRTRERSPRLARLFSLETRLKSVVSAESFCLGLDYVPRFSACGLAFLSSRLLSVCRCRTL